MTDGMSLGSATLDLGADLAALRADLDDAKARVAAAVAEMQAMLDSLHAKLDLEVGTLGGLSALDRGGVMGTPEHMRDLAAAYREHTEATRDLIAAGGGEHGGLALGVSEGVQGVRGRGAPGSLGNPIVVVIEAASRTPLGSLAAAVGEDSISQGDQRTVVATTQGSTTRVAAAGAPGTETQHQATDILATSASRGGGGSPHVTPGGTVTPPPERPSGLTEAELLSAAQGRQSSTLEKLLAAKGLAPENVTPVTTPGGKAVPVSVQDAAPEVTSKEDDATALALDTILGKLGNKQLSPGQYASVKPGYAAAYERLGYRVGLAPDQAMRLYGPGGTVGTGEYGGHPGDASRNEVMGWLLGKASGGGGGGGFRFGFRGLFGGRGGGGGESPLRSILYGSSWIPGTAGIGTLGSFAGFGPEHIALTVGGIAGSGVAALGGGALLATGALGKLGAGMGADLGVSTSAIADTTNLYKAVEKLREAEAAYGKTSAQAAEAREELNQKMKYELGGTKGVEAELHLAEKVSQLNTNWDKETSTARVAFVHLMEPLVEIGEKWIPLINTAATQNFTAMGHALQPLFAYLKGPEAMGIFTQLENEFRDEIPTAMQAMTEGFEWFGKTVSYLAPLTGKLISDLDKLFTRLNTPEGFAKWESLMTRLIGDFHAWGAFLKELGGALVDLFDKDAKTGETIIETLTQMLHHVREYEQSVTGAANLRNIFLLHREEAIALLHALAPLVDAFSKVYIVMAQQLVPVATLFLEVLGKIFDAVADLGPFGAWSIALLGIAWKLKMLVPLIKAVWGELRVMKGELLGASTAADTDSASNTTLAASETEVAAGAKGEGATVGAGALGGGGEEEVASQGLLASLLTKSNLIRGAIGGVIGGTVASAGAKAVGASGTESTLAGIVGVGIGATLATGNPVIGVGAAFLDATPEIVSIIKGWFKSATPAYQKHAEAQAHGAIGALGTTLPAALAHKRAGEIGKLLASAAPLREKAAIEEREGYGVYGGKAVARMRGEATAKEKEAGERAATAFKEGFEHTKFPEAGGSFAFLHQAIGELGNFSGTAQNAAAQSMIAMAAGFEREHKLPQGALKRIIEVLEHEFPHLQSYLESQGPHTSAAIASAVDLKKAEENVRNSLHAIESTWDLTETNIAQTEHDLIYIREHTQGIEKELAEKQLNEWRQHVEEERRLKAQGAKLTAHEQEEAIKKLATAMPLLGKPGYEKYMALVDKWAAGLDERVANSVETLEQGITKIDSLLSKALSEVGLTEGEVKGLVGNHLNKSGELVASQPAEKWNEAISPIGKAEGGLIQIGQPGEAGRDTVGMNVGGQPIMVAPGEQVAVFNRHQLPIVNAALADVGGLPGLFSAVTTPNYMAAGGIVAPSVSGSGALPALVRGGLSLDARAANLRLSHARSHGGGRTSAGGSYDRSALERLWIRAGGPSSMAHVMAAIALAESGGNPNAYNASGASGLWQVLGLPFPGDPFNPLENARMAVAKYESQGLGAWVTYTSGAYEAFMARGGLLGFARGGFATGSPDVLGEYAQSPSVGHKRVPKRHKPLPTAHAWKIGALRPHPLLRQWGGYDFYLELSKLMDSTGTIARLGEAYELAKEADEQAMLRLPHEGAFIVTPNTAAGESGSPFIDMGNVEVRRAQLAELEGMEGEGTAKKAGILAELHRAWKLTTKVLKWIHSAVAERQKAIALLQARIRANLAAIKKAHEKIKKEEARLKDKHHKLPTATRKAIEATISTEKGHIKAWERENLRLGGSATTLGKEGIIGTWRNQIAELNGGPREGLLASISTYGGARGEVEGYIQTLGGLTGQGGTIHAAEKTLAELSKEVAELGGEPLKVKLAEATGTETTTPHTEELNRLLKTQLEEQGKLLAVSQAQYGVLAHLPPWGGSFASGGTVPGPIGAPRLVVAHGGEHIGAAPEVHVNFAGNAGWLKDFVTVTVKDCNRKTGSRINSPLPSRGGGQF